MGSKVASVGYGAFLGDGLLSISIPDSVTNIGAAAFEYCSNLTSVIIGNNLASIPNFAFDACTSLTGVTLRKGVTSIGVDAFGRCGSLTIVTIPGSVTNIGDSAFLNCGRLSAMFFLGSPPHLGSLVFSGDSTIAYYLPQALGWGATFGSLPTVAWNPQVQTSDGSFGVKANRFGFNIKGSSNLVIVVEASLSLADAHWSALQTNVLTGGSDYFSDPQWTGYRLRFYRIRPP